MIVLIYFIRRATDSKFEWSFYDQYWLRINLPTDTRERGPPQSWGAGEDDWGLMGWSGYVI